MANVTKTYEIKATRENADGTIALTLKDTGSDDGMSITVAASAAAQAYVSRQVLLELTLL